MPFSRRKHHLPKFPPSVIPTFKSLCEALPSQEIGRYQTELAAEIEKIRALAAENPMIDLQTAQQLFDWCEALLKRYEEFDEQQRALVVGAIRYFLLDDDAVNEQSFATGLEDDAKVMNYVLEELGVEKDFVELKEL